MKKEKNLFDSKNDEKFKLELKTEYQINPIGIAVEKPRLSWIIKSSLKNVLQTAYHIQSANSLKDLKNETNLICNTGRIESDQSIHVEYDWSKPKSRERIYWMVKIWTKTFESNWSEGENFWEMGLLDINEWKAVWISSTIRQNLESAQSVPMFRRNFTLSKKIKSARIYMTALGIYELSLNGKQGSDALFAPGWTSYKKRLQYQTYDITSCLLKGDNVIGVTVGDGWYRGHLAGWVKDNRNNYGKDLGLLLQLEVNYTDGTTEQIVTDSTWKTSTGPILSADFYNGEEYNASLEKDGWNKAGYNDYSWNNVRTLEQSMNVLIAQEGPYVKKKMSIKPIAMSVLPNGDILIDMGQNMVGWIKFKAHGEKGQKIELFHAEVLDQDGNLYTVNLKGAKQKVSYTFGEKENITFEPHFTFQGFRYFSISGLTYKPSLDDFIGEVIYSDMDITGEFTCSDPFINKLQQNIQWGQRGNFVDVPTDCPQRSERLGWTGDIQVFASTATFNMNVATFLTKWLGDLAAEQASNGNVPHIVPFLNVMGEGGMGSAAWGDAATVVPFALYEAYGDTRILEKQYDSMKSWVDYMKNSAGKTYLYTSGFHYGDWLAFTTDDSDYPGATTDKDIISSAFFAYSTEILVQTAAILRKTEDLKNYSLLLKKIKNAFSEEFITPRGRVGSNTQTAYALALAFDLVPKEIKKLSADRFAKDVVKFGHITTGFVGTPFVCSVLSKFGYDDIAYMLLNRKEYPSWLYPVTKGATTIWERWDGIKPDNSFNTKSAFSNAADGDVMNSFNHYAYGAIGDWLYKNVAGIKSDIAAPGYKKIIIKPIPGGSLTKVCAKLETMYGIVSSCWEINENKFYLTVEIPANTTATIYLPGKNKNNIIHKTGSGKYTYECCYI